MSDRRGRRTARCPGCGLTPAICVCDRFSPLEFRTPLAIVQHVHERFKPTNTGRLLARMVLGTPVLPCGMRSPPFDASALDDPSIEWRLLFPRQGAPVLDPDERPARGRRAGFVLLDGSWRQCSHLSRRLPRIAELPCVALPPAPPSFWTVRAQQDGRRRSTFEAACLLIERLEGPAAAAPLRRAFAAVTAGHLHLKGRLPTPEVPSTWGV